MDLGLNGKVALVTGGTHGIGRSTAVLLAQEGCRVAVCGRDPEKMKETLDMIQRSGIEGIGVRADVLNAREIEHVIRGVVDAWGTIHILINNVGGGGRWGNENLEQTDEQVWMDVYQKNAMAAVRFTMRAIPYMRRQKWGRVITVTSVLGREAGGRPWFNMAKCAQTALMKNLSLRSELVRDGITFNSVAPGCLMIAGTGWDEEQNKDPEKFDSFAKEKFPLGRLGKPEEVANVIAFICSDQASLINGASVSVDGGESHAF